jgi:hypothetical protein
MMSQPSTTAFAEIVNVWEKPFWKSIPLGRFVGDVPGRVQSKVASFDVVSNAPRRRY